MEESVLVEEVPSDNDTFERDLLVRMQTCLSERKKQVLFTRAVSTIDWEKVAFDGYSAEECRERWQDIQSRLRVQRTLAELLEDAQASRWDTMRLRKALKEKVNAEGGPAKPLSGYLLFCQKMRPKLAKKHPHMSGAEMMTHLSKRYAAASPEKKEMYRARSAAARAEYKTAMEAFTRKHPELGIDSPPKRPLWAYEIYGLKHDMPRAEASAAYRALPREDKDRYARKAQRAKQRYLKEVEQFKELHPGWEVPVTATRIMRKQQLIDVKAEGLVRKARKQRKPLSAYHLFVKDMSAKADVPAQQRLKHCAELWHRIDAVTKQRYQALADEEKAGYQRYLESLPEEERLQLLAKPARRANPNGAAKRAKRRKRLTGKQLYVMEKMPTDFDALSEMEWRRILYRKYAKLSLQDKDMYNQRASTMRAEEAAENTHSDAAEDSAAGGDNPGTAASPVLNGRSSHRQSDSDDASLVSEDEARPSLKMDVLKLSDSESEGSCVEEVLQLTPTRQTGAGATESDEADGALSPAYNAPLDESWATENGTDTPVPRGNKRSKTSDTASSEEKEAEETSPKKKQKKDKKPALEEGQEEVPSSAFELFVRSFRPKSVAGLSPKKIEKKAKKAWNSMSDDDRRRAERRYAKVSQGSR